jgi:phosphate-selective porin OprO/OprP
VQWYAVALVVLAGVAQAQETAPPSNAELMRRIQELEATVKELKAQKSQPANPPTAALVAPPPPAPITPVVHQAPVDGALPFSDAPPGSMAAPDDSIDPVPSEGGDAGRGRPIDFEKRRSGDLQPLQRAGGLPPGEIAGWSNGFYIQSRDQNFVARVTGQIQADQRWYLNSLDTVDANEFLIRRARFGLESIMFDNYEFRLLGDFAGSQLNAINVPPSALPVVATPAPSIVDAYMNVHYWDGLQFLAGRFKQPFSYEQLIQDRYTPFLERSLIDQLTPNRDIGFMVHGQNLLDRRVDYFLAVSNGEVNGNFDNNSNKDVTSRIVVRPFGPNEGSFLQYLGFGLSGSMGEERQAGVQVNSSTSSSNVLRTPLGVPWLTFNAAAAENGERFRLSPEVLYFYGPFGFATQYYTQDQSMSAAATGAASLHHTNVLFHGYYFMGTLFLTGEQRTGYSNGVDPRRPFDPRCPFAKPGAWELVARVSQLHVSNNVFTPGAFNLAAPAGNANGCTEFTLGFNWYLNRAMMMRFNWEHDFFNRPVSLGVTPSAFLTAQDCLAVRFELAF